MEIVVEKWHQKIEIQKRRLPAGQRQRRKNLPGESSLPEDQSHNQKDDAGHLRGQQVGSDQSEHAI